MIYEAKKQNVLTNKKADFLMISVSLAFGFSYLFMKLGLESITVFQLISFRFLLAFVVLFMIFQRKIIPKNKTEWIYSILLGFFLFTMFTCLMYGLKTTQASTAGFLTGTTVIFVPIFEAIRKKQFPEKKVFLGMSFAIIGIGFLSFQSNFKIETGAYICLLGAILYAFQIMLTSHALHQSCESLTVGVWQLFFAGFFGLLAVFFTGQTQIHMTKLSFLCILGLAFLCSAYGFVMKTKIQTATSPERTSLFLTLEPVFSCVLAVLFLHEGFHLKELIGALCILFGIFL